MADVVKEAGLWTMDQQLVFPLIVKNGVNQYGKAIHYYFNYSNVQQTLVYPYKSCVNLLTVKNVELNEKITLDAWSFVVLELIFLYSKIILRMRLFRRSPTYILACASNPVPARIIEFCRDTIAICIIGRASSHS